jgi:hypothetical protein
MWKKVAQNNSATSFILRKRTKVTKHPIVENLPNLITLRG